MPDCALRSKMECQLTELRHMVYNEANSKWRIGEK